MRTGQEAFLTNIFFPGLRVKEFLECEIFGCTDNRITEQSRRFFSETKYLLFSWLLSSSLPFCMGKDSSNVEPFDTERAEQDRRLIWSVGCTSCEVYISNLTKENPFLQILKQCSVCCSRYLCWLWESGNCLHWVQNMTGAFYREDYWQNILLQSLRLRFHIKRERGQLEFFV